MIGASPVEYRGFTPREVLLLIYRRFGRTELSRPFDLGLPDQEETPGGVNIPTILWLRNLAVAFDMIECARMRYRLLGTGDHWVPGNHAGELDERAIRPAVESTSIGERVPGLLRDAHELLSEA